MSYEIKEVDGKFQLLDDGYVYSTYATRKAAEADKKKLEQDDKIDEEIEIGIDDLVDTVSTTYDISRSDALERIKDHLL